MPDLEEGLVDRWLTTVDGAELYELLAYACQDPADRTEVFVERGMYIFGAFSDYGSIVTEWNGGEISDQEWLGFAESLLAKACAPPAALPLLAASDADEVRRRRSRALSFSPFCRGCHPRNNNTRPAIGCEAPP